MVASLLSTRTWKAHSFAYPIRSFERQLGDLGIRVVFHYRMTAALFDADVVCIDSEVCNKRRGNPLPYEKSHLVARAREGSDVLVWFDTADHTGGTAFQLLGDLDLYCKSQLFRERDFHLRSWYADRIFSQYYHREAGVDEPGAPPTRVPAHPAQLDKLAVSWNLGLADFTTFSTNGRRWRVLTRRSGYGERAGVSPGSRELDMAVRLRTRYGLATVTHHRSEAVRRIRDFAERTDRTINPDGKLSYRKYRDEMGRAKVVPSPFGSGEICYRDFECFLAGATLVKPDMDHVDTWPSFYEADVTYAKHRWDFGDLEEVLADLLNDPSRAHDIAVAGQERFLAARSVSGGERFAKHFQVLMERAQRAAGKGESAEPLAS